ncbi:unnamed protein product [Tetraodon nigroviridis]|uniref:(spotted green pufferfish) hypothetical protein n=1 Tax=Tetraodon nigroviridis TaxID=99883 RepID=Q4S990_TETNG|nr:unnamed protein product [Tetraodon nigroviridis]
MLLWRAASHSISPVQGCFLAALDGRMIDEDYQVLLSDGQAFAQLWVLGSEDPPAGANLGQTLRDGQPAIITAQAYKTERPGAGKC